jgi:hypothetical protein
VEQARARARAKAKAIDKESELSDLFSSDFEGIEVETEGNKGSRVGGDEVGGDEVRGDEVGDSEVEALASPNLQLRLKRARLVPARYRD